MKLERDGIVLTEDNHLFSVSEQKIVDGVTVMMTDDEISEARANKIKYLLEVGAIIDTEAVTREPIKEEIKIK
jgi:hypothetical protein